jgi:hypothetical protein
MMGDIDHAGYQAAATHPVRRSGIDDQDRVIAARLAFEIVDEFQLYYGLGPCLAKRCIDWIWPRPVVL